MSDESAEFEANQLLRTIGKVQVPEPSVLEDAREVLWSAVADEMLGARPAGEQATVTGGSAGREEERRKRTRRRQAGRSGGERRMSMGGGGDPEK
jgi:hypothetical protein